MKHTKHKTIIALFLLIALISLSSCGNNPQPVNIYTGTQGLTINFMKNIPPEKVYEDMQFMVISELWNKGAFPLNYSSLNYGVVTLDYDPLYFTSISSPSDNTLFYEQDPKFELEGKSTSTPYGERKNKELAYFKVNKIPGTRESPKTTLTASVCYPYQTLLSQEVCVDMDYMNEDNHPPCRNQPSYSYSGQGAPIVISNIESSMIPLGEDRVQPSFKIKIRNTGSGLVFSRDQGEGILSICSPSSGNKNYSDINGLRIEATLGTGEIKLKCVPEIIKLYNDEADATCFLNTETVSLAQSRNYMTLLTIKLDYAYRSFTTKTIEIQRLPQ